MTDAARTFLLSLLNTPSPSGFEVAGQRVWADAVRPHTDAVEIDAYGNTWASRSGQNDAPRVMLEAHADEIGFMINHITEEGFLRVTPIGGSDRVLARGRRIQFLGDDGPVPGILGNTAIHLRDRDNEKVPKWQDLFVDVGAANPQAVADLGLRVGHPAVYASSAEVLGEQRLVGRAVDNRIGGFIIAQVMQRLAEGAAHAAHVFAVNAVQEEIGGNGAKMVTYRLQPNVAVVLDVTHATDTPGINKDQHGKVVLGGGPTVTHGTANHPRVVQRLIAVAEAEGIPLQHEASSRYTGTDTDDVFVSRAGVPSALVSLPMRYMHSPVELVDLADVERCIRLLTAFARSVQPGDRFTATLGDD